MIRQLIPLSIRKALGGWWHRKSVERSKAKLLSSLAGTGTICNVCRWEGRALADDVWHARSVCPKCGSQVRHRLFVAALDGRGSVTGWKETDLLTGRRVLHFAPERQLRARIRAAAASHVTADFDRGDCDLRLDISLMPSVETAVFETLIACDVLEHVQDDYAAFREIHRVLVPNGVAILTVPQRDPPAATDEDPGVTTEAERERRFGQKDHVRMYGDDFAARLAQAGFEVTVLEASQFSEADRRTFVLEPPERSQHPLATNHRRLYLARKQSLS